MMEGVTRTHDLTGVDSLSNLRTLTGERAQRYARTVVHLVEILAKEGPTARVMDVSDADVAAKLDKNGDPIEGVLRFYLEQASEAYFDAGWVQGQLESKLKE